jgi:hypothetical protein
MVKLFLFLSKIFNAIRSSLFLARNSFLAMAPLLTVMSSDGLHTTHYRPSHRLKLSWG